MNLVRSHVSKHKHRHLAQSVPDSVPVWAFLTATYIKAGLRVASTSASLMLCAEVVLLLGPLPFN